MKDFLREFKAFAVKGNVLELAIAVIIGTAFGKIVSSLVDNILMPIIGIFLGGINFSGLTFGVGDTMLRYGVFLQAILDFLIIAFIIFLVMRAIGRFKRTQSSVLVEEQAPEPTEEVQLLREIRDLLRRGE